MKLHEALTKDVRLIAHLLNNTPSLPSILTDSQYRIIDCSRGFEKMVGDKPVGQYLTSILKPISADDKIVPAFSTDKGHDKDELTGGSLRILMKSYTIKQMCRQLSAFLRLSIQLKFFPERY